MSSELTTYPGARETVTNPYPPSSSMAPGQSVGQGGQPHLIACPGIFPSSQLGQGNVQLINPALEAASRHFKEVKTLGAIQITIGLMHIGFGVILGTLSFSNEQGWGFASLCFVGGYPFWGGLSFIISGSLAISASREFSPSLIKSCLGMNIVSAIFSLIGVFLLVVDMCINNLDLQAYWALLSGKGISAMLMIFSILEFFITCATAHFARQINSNTSGSVLVIPTVYANYPLAPPRIDGYPAYAPRY